MSLASEIYDFETIIPSAVVEVFTEAGLPGFTILDAQQFQKTRPRCEIVYKHGGESTPKRLKKMDDGSTRVSCFNGELKIHAITDADVAGKASHSTFRAEVRNICASLQARLNSIKLIKHSIAFVVGGTEDHGVRSADGFEQTTFSYNLDISVKPDAWIGI